ncbi:hypothetical protein V8F33_000108 [Rhypophila sp. PSN 637]
MASQPAAAAAAAAAAVSAGYLHYEDEEEEATDKNHHHPERRRIITLIDTTPTASDELLTELENHLPFSIPVLRRIQFANKFPGKPGSTQFTHVLWAFYEDDEQKRKKQDFAAAYVDLSRGPETQCWIYCTLEDSFSDYYSETAPPISVQQDRGLPKQLSEKEQSLADELVLTILRRMWDISRAGHSSSYNPVPKPGPEPDDDGEESELEADNNNLGDLDYNNSAKQHTVLIGSLHETIRKRLLKLGVKMFKTKNVPAEIDWEFCNKWLFRVEDFPDSSSSSRTSETGVLQLKFDKVKRDDIPLILARTSIDRKPETLLRLPIAWAFTGLDGTLMTLHVEPSYRGLGVAKLIACKIMKDSLSLYGNDGWGAADVFVANSQSQGVCKSIGGKAWWTLSWALVDLDSVPGLPS